MTSARPAMRGDQGGFTLVELLTVIFITSIIGASIVGVVASVGRAETRAFDMSNNLDGARIAVERVRETVRSSFGVCDASDEATLQLWRRDDNDDLRVDPEERTTFMLVAGELRRQDGTDPPVVVVTGLSDDSRFTYLDREDTEVVPDPALPRPLEDSAIDCDSGEEQEGRGDVATVGLRLVADRSATGRTGPTAIESQVTLRNAVTADGAIMPNRTPIPEFTANCSGWSCTFDASGSHDEDGLIVEYRWDFGDGTSASRVLPTGMTKTYPSGVEELYAVTLTVVDDGGAEASVTQYVSTYVGNANPSAVFTHYCVQLTCTFDGSGSYDVDGEVVRYHWDLGDGTVLEDGPQVLEHTYTEAGSYSAALTVFDQQGAEGQQRRTLNPTAAAGAVVATLTDMSSTGSQSNRYFARVQVTLEYADGSPAVGVNVRGRFGGATAPLVSRPTNSQGTVTLQADADYHRNSVVQFTLVEVEGNTLQAGSQTSLTLRWPG